MAHADLGSLVTDLPDRRVNCWADATSSDGDANDALVSDHVLETKTDQNAAVDDPDAGASDSACNKTVCGNAWYDKFVKGLESIGLSEHITSEPENEGFCFGDGGRLVSNRRYRVPTFLWGKSGFIKISVVPCETLGFLMGKDIQKELGFKIDFDWDTLEAPRLDVFTHDLTEMRAGHYRIPIVSPKWKPPKVDDDLVIGEPVEFVIRPRRRLWKFIHSPRPGADTGSKAWSSTTEQPVQDARAPRP